MASARPMGADWTAWAERSVTIAPLPTVTPKFATWSLGGGRPFGCSLKTCQRWHAGIDLTGAPNGALVIAPEDGIIAGLDKGWTDGTRAIFLQTESGLFLVLGGVIAGSHKEFGVIHAQRVKKGDKLGRIQGSYGMLHLEAYRAFARQLLGRNYSLGQFLADTPTMTETAVTSGVAGVSPSELFDLYRRFAGELLAVYR